jgi:hypothetical protein
MLLPVVGVIAAVGVVQAGSGAPRSVPEATMTAGTAQPSPTRAAPAVALTELGHPLLGVTGGWELFGRGDRQVVRIELARGRVTTSTVPVLLSTGPVSFVVTADRALVRPIDRVPGYMVPDGRPVVPMPSSLSQFGPAFAGPRPGTVWVQSGDGPHAVMQLRAVDGGPVLATIRVPEPNGLWEMTSDSTGYLLLRLTGGYYHATSSGLRLITRGALLASGAATFLTLDCDEIHRCRSVVTDRATGARRTLGVPLSADMPRGAVAPNGRSAAMFRIRRQGALTLSLLNLVAGTERTIDLPIHLGVVEGSVVWSPDSRWLLAAGTDGAIHAVDPATGHVTTLGVSLPALSQLAVRP